MPLMDPSTRRLFGYFFRAYPGRSTITVLLLAVAGAVEGFGVATMLPLLELVTTSDAEPSGLSQAVANTVGGLGLTPSVGILLSMIVLAVVLKAIFLWVAMRQVGYTVAQVTTDLRMELLRALMRARWRYYASQPAGGFASAISSEANRASVAYREGCVLLSGILQILTYLTIALLVSWRMALAALVFGLFFLFLLRGLVQMARRAGGQQTDLMRSLVNRLTDALRGIKPIRAMRREESLQTLLEEETEELNQALRSQVTASETLRLVQEPTVAAMLALGLYGALTFGSQPFPSVLVLAFVFFRLMNHINSVQTRYQLVAVGESAFWMMRRQIEEAEAEQEPNPGTLDPPPLKEGVRLVNVDFAYEDTEVLKGLSLDVPSGRFVALYGPSGSGKTTIADLILGLRQPQAGRVEVDGVPLNEVDIHAWRRNIGYVPQEVFLFHDTILRNVTLGDESLSREAVEQALRDADAWDFVEARTEGVDAVIGEAGSKLSGGQRQRIAIARAIVHKPRLLILDEATAALDPVTEREILDTLRGFEGEVTILGISHQPALREVADIVYTMHGGTIEDVSVGATGAAR